MSFLDDLRALIDASYAETWRAFGDMKRQAGLFNVPKKTTDKWKTPGEPAFVMQLASHPFVRQQLANLIQRHLSPSITKGKPLASGIFIHQKPKVAIGKSAAQIELGDLLFVRHHFQTGSASPDGRAFLLQAKSTTTTQTGTLSGKEAKQFDLYANWNKDFIFPHGELGAPPDGSAKWNFAKGPTPYKHSGFYGLVSDDGEYATNHFPEASSWAVGIATAPGAGGTRQVKGTNSLAQTMESFLRGTRGRPWFVGAPGNDHWSHFVERILEESMEFKTWKTRVQRIGAIDVPRHHQALAFVSGFALQNSVWNMIERGRAAWSDGFPADEIMAGSEFIAEQAKAWLESTEGGGDETLPPAELLPRPPGGGMSVVYVATFGDAPLERPSQD